MIFAQNGGELFVGGCMGAIMVAIIWAIHAAAKSQDSSREFWQGGYHYSTKEAQRVFGCTGERINDKGQWVCYIISIWRTYPSEWRKTNWCFFLLEVDELNSSKVTPLSNEQSAAFIHKYAGQEAAKLIRDWMSERDDTQPIPTNNDNHLLS